MSAIPFAEKVALCQQIDAAARARDPRVAQVSVSLSGSWSVIDIVRGDGFTAPTCDRWFDSTSRSLRRTATAARPAITAWAAAISTAGCSSRSSGTARSTLRLRQALINLESVAAPAGEMPVVLGPGWPGVLLHEAVGHGLEGDFNRKGKSAFSGRIGERVAAPGVTVIDDGAIHDRRGSLTIDDEGTPTGRTVLIEDGILKGYLQDRLNARLMGVEPTGNGRRESFAHAPMPRMTNTFMLARQGRSRPS